MNLPSPLGKAQAFSDLSSEASASTGATSVGDIACLSEFSVSPSCVANDISLVQSMAHTMDMHNRILAVVKCVLDKKIKPEVCLPGNLCHVKAEEFIKLVLKKTGPTQTRPSQAPFLQQVSPVPSFVRCLNSLWLLS